jgi:hypothetical protein
MADRETHVIGGAVWMLVISVLLFWLPVAGPLVAGVVGGKKAGGVGAGIMAALVPAIAAAIALFLSGTLLTGVPLIGVLAGAGAFVLVVAHVGPLLLGAIVGGILA